LPTVTRELIALADPRRAEAVARFFKTGPGEYGAGDRFLGITVPSLRTLAARHRALPMRDLSSLLSSEWHEARLLALFIMVRRFTRAEPAEQHALHRLYMRRLSRVNNWDLVDSSAEVLVGAYLRDRNRAALVRLATSARVWTRRVAIIATFHYIKRGEFAETLRIACVLVNDPDDLIHKAVGWMLREVGKRDRAVEEVFLRRHASRMPRTMLRYAIERFPKRLRRRYLLAGRAPRSR
jgi:3-methyladenine DNA glycosylase AlkD